MRGVSSPLSEVDVSPDLLPTKLPVSGSEEEGGLQEQLFVTIMELLHTILWRFYEKAGSLTKDQIGRILLTIDDLEKKIFKSTSVIKMRCVGVLSLVIFT